MGTDTETTSWVTEARVREMIGRALTRADMQGLDIDETEIENQVLSQQQRLEVALRVELAEHREAQTWAADRVERWSRLNRQRVWAHVIANVVVGVSWLLFFQSILSLDWPWPHIHLTAGSFWLIGLTTLGSTITVNVVSELYKRRLARDLSEAPALRDLRNIEVDLAERAQVEAEALVREAVNALDAPGSTTGSLLTRSQAPALVELEAGDTVSAAGLSQVEEFIDRHSTSAIGVAGPRGVGKTTVLRRVSANAIDSAQSKSRLGVYVQSPVYYHAADFVRTVHEEIARAILREARVRYEPPELRVERRIRALRAAIFLVLLICGGALFGVDLSSAKLPAFSAVGLLGVTLLGISGCYLIFGWSLSRAGRRAARWSTTDPIDLARREIRKLTWNANVSSKEKTTLKLLPGLNSDSEQQTSYVERDRSHPDRVSDLRTFLREFHQAAEVSIVVAIDELDKMASPEQAIEAINGLKDLFHMQNTHFVVSVSEDALASFALRGVPVRDVFDSSFDDVVRMRPFSAENSVNLLLGRTVKFPRVASLFCHAISGGLPRDLIRAARRIVEARRIADADIHVTTAFRTVVANDLTEAMEAAGLKAREAGAIDEEVQLVKLKLTLAEQIDLGIDTLATRPELLTSIAPELASFVLTLVTIREYFDHLLHQPNWRQLIKASDTIAMIDELAVARSLVAVSRLDCLRRLVHIRAQAGLPAIPDTITYRIAPTLADYYGKPSISHWRTRIVASVAALKQALHGEHFS